MEDLLPFCYSSWQSHYSTHTFKVIVVDLTPEFVDFLQEGSIIVSSSSRALPQRGKPTEIVLEGVDYDPEDNYSSEADSNDAESSGSSSDATGDSPKQQPWPQRFPELHVEIESAIQQLGGQVAPKLNWSSPTDALWISSYNSLKCCNADQVMLLLKSSDRIMHDVELVTAAQQQQLPAIAETENIHNQRQHEQQQHVVVHQSVACQACPHSAAAAAPVSRPQLVLRQWHDLLPEGEFRCFVCHHKVIAISQRNVSQHFPQLAMSGELDTIKKRIMAFHSQHIMDTFCVDSYALDVYAPPGSSPPKILDFNPICSTTSPLLFSWNELPYTHMHCMQHPEDRLDHQQQQHQDQEQQAEQQQPAWRQQQQEAEYCVDDVELRVVCDAGMIMPGARAATGMPLDMLGLQDSFEEVLRTMKHHQQQEEESH